MRRVVPRDTGYTPAGMGRGATHIQLAEWRPIIGITRRRPLYKDLIQAYLGMMHMPAGKAEHRFYVLGREDLPVDHVARKTWRVLGERARHVVPQFVLSTILP